MDLLTPELREQLIANGRTPDTDRIPACKFFNPAGTGTWLITHADPDEPDRLFGLADLGMGFPELGFVSLAELQSFEGPFGLGIERDLFFEPRHPISVYARAASAAEYIVEASRELDAVANRRPPAIVEPL